MSEETDFVETHQLVWTGGRVYVVRNERGGWSIVKPRFGRRGGNVYSASIRWQVYRDGIFFSSYSRKRDAIAWAKRLATVD